MISEAEILQIINEIHQYDMVLLELRDRTIFGIARVSGSVPTYFRARGAARSAEDRRAFFEAARSSKAKAHVDVITLDTMLNGLRGMRPRHIWLERKSRPAREMAFLSLKELAVFLREHEA